MASDPHVPTDTAPLRSGSAMPLLGFGTWQLKGRDAATATAEALAVGYRHLDTATVYRNEAEVGRGLADSGVPREEVFVTTKCPPGDVGHALDTLRGSLDLLGLEYVDLWLVHWAPEPGRAVELWQSFVESQQAGLARAVGVSNFDAALLEEVTSATGVQPEVNQIEWSPLLHDPRVLEEHRSRGVVLEGYSGLKGGTLEHPVVRRVAEETGRTPAQVIVRWHLQHGIVVIPKSRQPERIRANADVAGFSLTEEQMAALDAMGPAA